MSKGVDINTTCADGGTLAHKAARLGAPHSAGEASLRSQLLYAGRVEGLEFLYSHGADLNRQNSRGLTPFQVAVKRGKGRVVRRLKELGQCQQ
jgi:ankyrin repeat protein